MTNPTPPESRRDEVLRALRETGDTLSIAEIARRVGVHVNTARFHLQSLTATGHVEQVTSPATGPGRPALMFRAPRRMDPTGPRNYRILADMLLSELAGAEDPVARAIGLGRRWGLRAASPPAPDMTAAGTTAWLLDLLTEAGFVPHPTADGDIGVRNCPFLELVEPHDRLACALHLGFMRGAVENAGNATKVRRLLPFAEPDLCLVVLDESGSRR